MRYLIEYSLSLWIKNWKRKDLMLVQTKVKFKK